MSTIIANQRSAFVARAMSSARRLADDLQCISPAEQFAVLATTTAAVGAPVDSVLLTDDPQDCTEAASLLDGVLARHATDRWAWHVGSGCYARIHLLPKETIV